MTAPARATDWQIFQLAASGLTPAQIAARTGHTETEVAATIREQAERHREQQRQAPAPPAALTSCPDNNPDCPTCTPQED